MSNELITINKLELASELANRKLIALNEWKFKYIKISDDGKSMVYTDDAQDIFNKYYDEYITLIESCR